MTVSYSSWASRGYVYDARGSVSATSLTSNFGKNTPRRLIISDSITAGMMITTGSGSYAVIVFDDGQVISMQANSTLLVRSYIYFPLKVELSSATFSLLKGGMRFVSGYIAKSHPDAFKLSTPTGNISVNGTDFYVVMTPDGLYSKVLSGSIRLTNAAGSLATKAGDLALTESMKDLAFLISSAKAPFSTFREIAAIPVPPPMKIAVVQPQPKHITKLSPLPNPVTGPATASIPPKAPKTVTASAGAAAAGGASTGGASFVPTLATASEGMSGTTIWIGLGVAAGLAALTGTSSTTSH